MDGSRVSREERVVRGGHRRDEPEIVAVGMTQKPWRLQPIRCISALEFAFLARRGSPRDHRR
jgi:hypothetical protein